MSMINADKARELYIKGSLPNDKENITQENIIADLNAGGFAPVAKQ
ncbi:hypothetical protein AGMMS49573_06710 [Endomicrobiia bacterium]|nr:hypothetical protein AGMMS49523_10450 [Endomicrobiia bacterium]GHT08364.1 hypothetical protein AGMMS49532_03230 [Endomicrobiia bacterium]GHT11402.1 hypothetical protein AGMMS49571_01630 [Endomicrobiia bacterium]GHT16592.1 hypothetical protein AGMMS49573_06710 [Endomicrobiia bacterium]GHT20419.1 hypothetical protein AGMMS49929_06920 [Endomicrobiia bacterium]